MSHQDEITLAKSVLGKETRYDFEYDPNKLYPISRKGNRADIGIAENLPFAGCDIWNHYEVSWLNGNGKPIVAIVEIIYNCDSPKLIESKSMKLYFNSFNNAKFGSIEIVKETIKKDIEQKIESSVEVNIIPLNKFHEEPVARGLQGKCIDDLNIACDVYTVHPDFLKVENEIVEETLYSDLLKSNCLVTSQPDWGSVQIAYKGKKINEEGLLRYIVSFRNHNEFAEHCIERIFVDIMNYCQPEALTVYGRYTRRGGLDINPYRSTKKAQTKIQNIRLCRQ